MPKVIVLFHNADPAAESLVEKAASGASSVRFTEVDVRSIGQADPSPERRRTRSASVDEMRAYDGVIVACCAEGLVLDELIRLVDDLGAVPNLNYANVVFTVLGAGDTRLLAHVARLGGIVVTTRSADQSDAHAATASARTAKVVSWVRHSLSHEHDRDHHDHEHHDHEHSHHHSHEHRPTA
ncbi:MAG: hypothetical protein ABJF01_02700 [bacterium]